MRNRSHQLESTSDVRYTTRKQAISVTVTHGAIEIVVLCAAGALELGKQARKAWDWDGKWMETVKRTVH